MCSVWVCSDRGGALLGTNPGRTHRFYTGAAVLPFGYGLSYTSFQYTLVATPSRTVSVDGVARALAEHQRVPTGVASGVAYTVNVTNTGRVDAADVVLGFLTPPGAGTDGVPLQSLFGFERVFVKAGATVSVYLGAQATELTQVCSVRHDPALRWPVCGLCGWAGGSVAVVRV